jgi:hypothetical protein
MSARAPTQEFLNQSCAMRAFAILSSGELAQFSANFQAVWLEMQLLSTEILEDTL